MAGIVTAEKHVIANPADTYGYTAEQRALAASIRSIVPVAHRTEAETIATAMAADGRPVSDTNPLVVFRLDNQRIEIKTAGGWGGPPGGSVAYTQTSTYSAAITGVTVVLNIPTYTFKAGRTYRLDGAIPYLASDATSTHVMQIVSSPTTDGASAVTNLTELVSDVQRANVGGEGRRLAATRFYTPVSDTTFQPKLTLQRVVGAGTVQSAPSAQNPAFLSITDLGVQQGLV